MKTGRSFVIAGHSNTQNTVTLKHSAGIWNPITKRVDETPEHLDTSETPIVCAPMGYMCNYGHFVLDDMYPLFKKLCLLNVQEFDLLVFDPLFRTKKSYDDMLILVSVIGEICKPRKIFFEPKHHILFKHIVFGNTFQKFAPELLNDIATRGSITFDPDFWLYRYSETAQMILMSLQENFRTERFVYGESFELDKHTANDFTAYPKYVIKSLGLTGVIKNAKLVTISISTHRRILNIDDIQSEFQKAGFLVEIVDFASIPMSLQITQVLQSSVLVGTPGGSLTNGIFMPVNTNGTKTFIVELWPPMAKFFYRKYFVHDSALIAAGNVVIACDKLVVDHRDQYHNVDNILPPIEYIERVEPPECSGLRPILKLKDSHCNYESITAYPHCVMYNLVDVSFNVDMDSLSQAIKSIQFC